MTGEEVHKPPRFSTKPADSDSFGSAEGIGAYRWMRVRKMGSGFAFLLFLMGRLVSVSFENRYWWP